MLCAVHPGKKYAYLSCSPLVSLQDLVPHWNVDWQCPFSGTCLSFRNQQWVGQFSEMYRHHSRLLFWVICSGAGTLMLGVECLKICGVTWVPTAPQGKNWALYKNEWWSLCALLTVQAGVLAFTHAYVM